MRPWTVRGCEARRDERAGVDGAARRGHADTLAVLDSDLTREGRRDLAEELRLQLGEVRERARHAASGVMFREPVCRQDIGVLRVTWRLCVGVVGSRLPIRGRVHLLAIQAVVDGGLERFVVHRQRTVLESFRHPDPAEPVAVHDERRIAAERGVPSGARRWDVVRSLVAREVGRVEACPLVRLGVPPDELLAVAPW